MLIANEPKFEDVREIVDEEVTRRVIEKGITRSEAYVAIAKEFGYHVRAFCGNEGWACVIAIPGYDWLVALAQRIIARRERDLQPLMVARDQMTIEIAGLISHLKHEFKEHGIDGETAVAKLTELEEMESKRNSLSKEVDRLRKRIQSEFAKEFCTELAKQIVIFGVSVEVALIACILRILDPQCNAFLTPEQIRSTYTTQDLSRKAGALRSRYAIGSDDQIPILDDNVDDSRRILALGVGRMIRAFIQENGTAR